jgi:predicted DNA-binding transcriptional regulator YafY
VPAIFVVVCGPAPVQIGGMAKREKAKPIVRQWQVVLWLLRHRAGLRFRTLVERTGIPRSTLYEDLKVLRDVFQIDVERRGGEAHYVLVPTDLPRLALGEEQTLALEVARRLLGPLDGTSLLDAYDQILASLGRPVRRRAAPPTQVRAGDVRRVVDDALQRRRRLRFEFVRVGDSAAQTRTVDPIGWRLVGDGLYLLGLDEDRDEWRYFAAIRMRDPRVLAEESLAFDEPRFAVADELDTLPRYEVAVRLSAVAAAHLAERPLCPQQAEVPLPGGELEVRGPVAGLIVAADWVQSWGPEAVALAPAELVVLVRARLERALARYA